MILLPISFVFSYNFLDVIMLFYLITKLSRPQVVKNSFIPFCIRFSVGYSKTSDVEVKVKRSYEFQSKDIETIVWEFYLHVS